MGADGLFNGYIRDECAVAAAAGANSRRRLKRPSDLVMVEAGSSPGLERRRHRRAGSRAARSRLRQPRTDRRRRIRREEARAVCGRRPRSTPYSCRSRLGRVGSPRHGGARSAMNRGRRPAFVQIGRLLAEARLPCRARGLDAVDPRRTRRPNGRGAGDDERDNLLWFFRELQGGARSRRGCVPPPDAASQRPRLPPLGRAALPRREDARG